MKKLFNFKQFMNFALAFLMVFSSIAWNGLTVEAETTDDTGNLIFNGDFEKVGTDGTVFDEWTETGDVKVNGTAYENNGLSVIAHNGNNAATVIKNVLVEQNITVEAGETYELTGYIYLNGQRANVFVGSNKFSIYTSDHSTTSTGGISFTDAEDNPTDDPIRWQWNKFTCKVKATENTLNVKLSGQSGYTLFDDIALRKVVEATGVSINDDAETVSVEAGETVELTATVTPAEATDKTVTWSSNEESVATVDATTGVVTGVSAGSATITAKVGENVTDTITVNVTLADVAQIEGGEKYQTLREAIEAAEELAKSATEDVVITLLDDVVSEENLMIGNRITLDLNGKKLTASSLATFKGNVIDSKKTGLLDVDSAKCAFSESNSQMPVYNGEGYVFVTITPQETEPTVTEGVFKLIFKPLFGETINGLLADSSVDTKISFRIRLDWKVNGTSVDPVYLEYTDEMVQQVYGNGMAFSIKASGVSNYDGLTITPLIVSDQGAEWSNGSFSNFE